MWDWGWAVSGAGRVASCTWAEETPPRNLGGTPGSAGATQAEMAAARWAAGAQRASPVWSAGGHRSPAHGRFSWSPHGPPEAPAGASGAQGRIQPPGLLPGRQACRSCAVAWCTVACARACAPVPESQPAVPLRASAPAPFCPSASLGSLGSEPGFPGQSPPTPRVAAPECHWCVGGCVHTCVPLSLCLGPSLQALHVAIRGRKQGLGVWHG